MQILLLLATRYSPVNDAFRWVSGIKRGRLHDVGARRAETEVSHDVTGSVPPAVGVTTGSQLGHHSATADRRVVFGSKLKFNGVC